MKLLPQTKAPLLRLIVIGLVVGCICLSFLYVRQSVLSQLKIYAVSIVLLIPLAAGLWLLMPWARVVALSILWIIVFAFPFCALSPWAVIDSLSPYAIPVWQVLLYQVAPLVIPAVFSIEILHGYRSEFQWPRDAEGTTCDTTSSSGTMLPHSWFLWCLAVIGAPALLTSIINLNMRLEGGCIPLVINNNSNSQNHPDLGLLWFILPMACVGLGLIGFLYADHVGAGRKRKTIRSLFYVAGMYLLCTEIVGYVRFTHICG